MRDQLRVGIVVFPGSNCDRDVAYVTGDVLGWPTQLLWHEETHIADYDLIVLPGGLVLAIICAAGRSPAFHPSWQQCSLMQRRVNGYWESAMAFKF
nr:hypothetical protein [Thermostichus lividus]